MSIHRVGRASVPEDAPQLRDRTIALLQHLEWRGLACVEYKLDPRDGRYRLMEINGRCPLSNALPTRCGVNYPLLAWREHALKQPVSATPNAPTNDSARLTAHAVAYQRR